ncbi:hypothetical protein AHF37_08727 [Paragonimus kellicotti]|nr:hypothetical protein AHF37_08727 [Paragonimus kellicotti]
MCETLTVVRQEGRMMGGSNQSVNKKCVTNRDNYSNKLMAERDRRSRPVVNDDIHWPTGRSLDPDGNEHDITQKEQVACNINVHTT